MPHHAHAWNTAPPVKMPPGSSVSLGSRHPPHCSIRSPPTRALSHLTELSYVAHAFRRSLIPILLSVRLERSCKFKMITDFPWPRGLSNTALPRAHCSSSVQPSHHHHFSAFLFSQLSATSPASQEQVNFANTQLVRRTTV